MSGAPLNIDWKSDANEVIGLLKLAEQQAFNQQILPEFKSHIFIKTSGSTSQQKWVALSKKALLVSAEQVNKHIKASRQDIWYSVLPHEHIGGLSVWLRADLLGISVVTHKGKWQPKEFAEQLQSSKATLSSIVPTQLFDIVQQNIVAPETLRVVFVGGGYLSESLYKRARELAWPILPTYGMTECASQVATARLDSLTSNDYPELEVLPHVKAEVSGGGKLNFSGKSLLSAYIIKEGTDFNIKKVNGNSFTSEDLGEIYVANDKDCLKNSRQNRSN